MNQDKLRRFIHLNIFTLMAGTLFSALKNIGKPVRPHTIETEEANFVLLTGTHGMGKLGQEVILPSGIPIHAVFLETGSFTYLEENTTQFDFPKQRFEEMAFYHKLIPELKKKQIPMLFGDIPFPQLSGYVLMGLSSLVTFGATIGGVFLATKGSSKDRSIKKTVGSALSLWGISSLIKNFITTKPEFIRDNKNKEIRRASFYTELTHPENMLEIFRNAVIAEKLLYYSEKYNTIHNTKPTIAIVMGSGHEYITEYLIRGRTFCQKVLSIYPKFILKMVLGNHSRNYYPSLFEVTYKDDIYTDKIYIDPTLER